VNVRLTRLVGFIDLGIAAVVLVMIVLPPREMYAQSALKGSAEEQWKLAQAEARVMAHRTDTTVIADYSRRLTNAGFRDWSVENAVRGEQRTQGSPQHWRALLAASVAYTDRMDVEPALDYANKTLGQCDGKSPECPTWERTRVELYQRYLDAGYKSGINPWRDPIGFRKAGDAAMRTIRINGPKK
jgi:hypothetical protein